MNILIIISLSISVFSLTVAFFMYLALSTLNQQNRMLLEQTVEICDSTNQIISQNLKLQEIVNTQYEVIEKMTENDLPV
jgi:hypothetical protein